MAYKTIILLFLVFKFSFPVFSQVRSAEDLLNLAYYSPLKIKDSVPIDKWYVYRYEDKVPLIQLKMRSLDTLDFGRQSIVIVFNENKGDFCNDVEYFTRRLDHYNLLKDEVRKSWKKVSVKNGVSVYKNGLATITFSQGCRGGKAAYFIKLVPFYYDSGIDCEG